MELGTHYDPAEVESKWYAVWRERGYFTPVWREGRPVFSVVLPPPNVTGVLHVGHALNGTWQDVLVRYHRMRGDNTLWLPGSDHAGIHTQMKVDEQIRARGEDRRELGREAFLAEAWAWKEAYGGEILKQMARLGNSVDWSRLRFTLDEGLSRAVTEVFCRLYEEGLIYRGDYITNWCVSCRTALSDIEVEHREESGQLTSIRYPLVGRPGFIEVATTRPETLLGDSGVAVHPDDARYRDLVGLRVRVPLVDRDVPIVADRAVDPAYGTGAVKVTPAHDPNDFEIGERHGLARIKVIDEVGRMTDNAGGYAGLSREEARVRVLADLGEGGLVTREETITHAVGHCEKCGAVIEPLISRQWFVSMKPLAGPALAAVDRGLVQFRPERFERIYRHWIENLHDWCVSRQLWWGHRIPAYYCVNGDVVVSRTPPEACPTCGGALTQDEDVLDTWFSSALWPFSTLGWPDRTEDLARYYPTSVLCTAHDIILFWVSRMIMQGLHFTAEPPFRTVLIHGLVRDAEGRKMSKSLGNGVDPMEMIDRYGADALRLALVLGSEPGNDVRFVEERVEAAMHFANKVYNAVRFVLMNLESPVSAEPGAEHPADSWIRDELSAAVSEVTRFIESYEFGEAARAVYDFFWDDFCDWYIELAKVRLRDGRPAERAAAQRTLTEVAETGLRLLHPFMPFVTEELWQALPHAGESIMLAAWPEETRTAVGGADWTVGRARDAIRTARNLRAEVGLKPGERVDLHLVADDEETLTAWENLTREIESLTRAQIHLARAGDVDRPRRAIAGVTSGGAVYLPLTGVIDLDQERSRLAKAHEAAARELERLATRLSDPVFRSKAPEAVVAGQEAKAGELKAKLERLGERLRDLD